MIHDRKHKLLKALNYILLISGSIILLLPILSMISTAVKDMKEIMGETPHLIPKRIHLDNFIKTWKAAPFTRYTLNSIFLTTFSVIGNVFVNSMVAFGFAKLEFKGHDFLFVLVLSTMMIPGFVTMIPQYIMFSKMGWINTYLPMIVPSFLGNSFNIFLLRQFYRTIPDSMIEAAKIEGAGPFRIWWQVAMPTIKPAHLTVAILSFNGAWNDFLRPLLYLNDEKMYNLQIGLQIFKEQSNSQWNYLMAGSLIVLVPVILIFVIFQKHFIEGANISAKEKEI